MSENEEKIWCLLIFHDENLFTVSRVVCIFHVVINSVNEYQANCDCVTYFIFQTIFMVTFGVRFVTNINHLVASTIEIHMMYFDFYSITSPMLNSLCVIELAHRFALWDSDGGKYSVHKTMISLRTWFVVNWCRKIRKYCLFYVYAY